MTEQVSAIGQIAATLRANSADLSLFTGFLFNAISETAPSRQLEVERKRSFSDRLSGREGEVVAVRTVFGDQRFSLQRPSLAHPPQASISHVVKGIVLSTRDVSLDQWFDAFAAALVAEAETTSQAAARIAKAFGLHT